MLKYVLSRELADDKFSILQKVKELTGINLFGVGGQTAEILTVWRDNERLLECPVIVTSPGIVTEDFNSDKMKINEQDLCHRIEELVGEIAPATNMIFAEDELLIFSVLYWKNKTRYDNAFTVTVAMLIQRLMEMKSEDDEKPESLEKRVEDLEKNVSGVIKILQDVTSSIERGVERDELCMKTISALTDRFKWLCEGLGSQK